MTKRELILWWQALDAATDNASLKLCPRGVGLWCPCELIEWWHEIDWWRWTLYGRKRF